MIAIGVGNADAFSLFSDFDFHKGCKVAKTTRAKAAQRALNCWKRFQEWMLVHGDSRWVYRGLGDAAFELVPGVGRGKYDAARERIIYEIFERRAAEYVDLRALSDWGQAGFGAAPRLADKVA